MPHIHRATPEDWARTRALRLAALADTPDAFGRTLAEEAEQPPSFWQDRLLGQAVTLIAVLDGTDAGIAVVAPQGEDAGLYGVWVAPFARGRGVGDALIREALALAKAAGHRRVVLDVGDHNPAAIALYVRWGFEPTGRRSTLPPPRTHVAEHELARILGAGGG